MKNYLLLILTVLFSTFGYSQLTQDFEGAVFPPPTWAVFDNGVNAAIPINWNTSLLSNGGVKAAIMDRPGNIGATNISRDFLATPSVTVPINGQLKFYTKKTISIPQPSIKYQIRIKLVSAGAQNDPTGYVIVQEYNDATLVVTNNVYEQKTVDIPAAYQNVPVYIAFCLEYTQAAAAPTGNRWLVDDVGIVQQCFTPADTTLSVAPIFATTATLNWTATAGTASYDIENVLATGTFTGVPTGNSTTSSFVQTGLTALTCYKYKIRANCDNNNFGPWSTIAKDYCTAAAPPVCGGNFVDNGGASNYLVSSDVTTTICPTNAGDVVTVTFNSFETEVNYDKLYVYDGNTVNPATQIADPNNGGGFGPVTIPGGFWGTISPGTVTSTSPDGCLTFRFVSDTFGQLAGWNSTVTCGPRPTCAKPKTLITSAITSTNTTLAWTQPANFNGSTATNWQVIAVACGSTPPIATNPNWITTTTNPYTFTSLSADTCYDFYVKAICSPTETSALSNSVSATTQVTPPACGGNFVDNGGATADYLPSSDVTTTICPTIAGDVVTVTFNSFETEVNYDKLYVYDGNTVNPATQIADPNNGGGFGPVTIPGGFWGTISPGTVTSTSPDGCLTFRFVSDTFGQLAGWNSTITCGPRPTCAKPKTLITSAVTSTNATLAWTQPANFNGSTATTWQVIAVACGSTPPVATNPAWITTTSNPYTFTTLSADTCYTFYVKAICSPTDTSALSNSVSATTQVTPPVCGGNFVDNGGATADYLPSSDVTTTICPTIAGDVVTVTFNTFNTETNWDKLYVYDGNTVNPATQIADPNNGGGFGPVTIPGGFWGTISPGTVTSTSPDGCLTFRFVSDTSGQFAGWNSTITCGPRPTCAKPKTLITSAVTSTSTTLAWTQPANFNGSTATTWQIIAVACGSTPPVTTNPAWITTTNNPYIFTTLSADTCYDFYVKAICSPTETSALSNSVSATTQVTPPACGGVYTDNGGSTADYLVSSDVTTTICPTNAGDVVTVTFNSFETEVNYDKLYVYDGNTVNPATQIADQNNGGGFGPVTIPGGFWGTISPGTVTSTSPDGCLTFRFVSDTSGQFAGWNSTITCGPRPTCTKPKLLPAINPTQTGVTLGWTQLPNPNASVATAWQYLILPAGTTAPTATSTGWTATSTSTNNIATGLTSATCYDYYVRAVCSATDSSFWAGPKSFCTLIANDECANATTVLTNPNQSCANIAAGSLIGATPSAEINNCGTAQPVDAWFKFIATATSHSINLNNVVGGAFNLNYALYSGPCNNLTQISCVNNPQGISSNLVIGQTYTIRVFLGQFANNSNITFNVCVGTIPPAILTNTTQYTEQQLVTNILLNSTCASVSNITFATESNGIGYFDQNGSTFPFANGVVLSTGNAANAFGPNTSLLSDGTGGSASDPDLEAIILAATGEVMNSKNRTKLEFDFTPITSNISFDFLFASEEYGTFQCSFSDAFAFLLTNLSTGVTTNLAIVPGTTTPISVVTVRKNEFNTTCASVNPNYFGQFNNQPPASGVSSLNSPTNFNGQTVPLTATSAVTINQPYHIKLVIADRGDTAFDSAVFLKGSSFGIGNLNIGSNLLQANGTALCFGTTRVLDTTLDPLLYTFEWKKDGIIIVGQTGPTLTVNSPGTYSVHVSYTGSNCSGDDSIVVEYFPEIVPGTAVNLASCNNTYNLTQNNSVLLNSQTGLTVKYYLNTADATADINPILNPSVFAIPLPVIYPYTICARIQNAGNCFKVVCFNLELIVATASNFDPITPICSGSVAPLLLGTSPNGISGTWSPSAISNAISGSYSFTPGSGCYVGQTINVTVIPVATPNFAQITPFCAGTVAPLLLPTSPNGIIGSWFPAIISNTTSGFYKFTSNNVCDNIQILNVVVNPVLVSNFAQIAPFCAGTAAPLLSTTSPNGVVGTWLPAIISNTTSGSYIFTPTGPCFNKQTLSVVVYPIRTPDFALIAAFCSGTTAPILAGTSPNGVAGTWFPAVVSNTISGSYKFTPTNSCDIDQILNVVIIQKTTPTFAIADICQGEPLVLPTSSTNATAILGTWNPATANTNNVGIFTTTFKPNADQCANDVTISVNIKEVPMFGITGNCQGGNYTLDVVPVIAGATYVWTDAAGTTLLNNSGTSTQVVTSIGDYKCKVTNANGCNKTITLNVTNVVCEIQKGISPNGDSRNDKFDLTTLNVKHLEIFNRYGLRVYHLTNYTNEWEGQTDGGVALPDGTYYYVAELGDGNTKTGWVYINKQTN